MSPHSCCSGHRADEDHYWNSKGTLNSHFATLAPSYRYDHLNINFKKWPWRMIFTEGECVPDEVIHSGDGQRESVTLLVQDSGHVIN